MYRPAEERLKDWNEVYNFEDIRKNLRTQAARYFLIVDAVNVTILVNLL